MTEEKLFYTIDEAAKILNVSTETIKKMCRAETIKWVNINPEGKKPTWRITKESIEKLSNKEK